MIWPSETFLRVPGDAFRSAVKTNHFACWGFQNAMKHTFQFRLKTLLACITACAIALAYLMSYIGERRTHGRAVLAIQDLGGRVGYDFQMDASFHPNKKIKSKIPLVIQSSLGEAFFHDVEYVTLIGDDINDEDLVHLESMPHLKKLLIMGGSISKDGLRYLSGLQNLEDLSLGVRLDDEALRHLYPLKSLQHLFLMGDSTSYRYSSSKQLLFDNDDYDSGVTEAGVARLSAQIPGCRISY